VAKEDKSDFEEIEKKLSITPEMIGDQISRGVKNIYQSYRKKSNLAFFRVLAYGTYIARSGLTVDEVVKSIEHTRDIKGIK